MSESPAAVSGVTTESGRLGALAVSDPESQPRHRPEAPSNTEFVDAAPLLHQLHRKTSAFLSCNALHFSGKDVAVQHTAPSSLRPPLFPGSPETAEVQWYVLHVILPQMLRDQKEVKAWFEFSFSDPMSTHAAVFVAACHHDLLHRTDKKSKAWHAFSHKVKAITLLKEAIENFDSRTDQYPILWTTTIFATCDVEDVSDRSNSLLLFEPHPPTARWVSVFGKAAMGEAHARATPVILARIGGLDRLDVPGLSEQISWIALRRASSGLVHPSHEPLLQECYWTADKDILKPLPSVSPRHRSAAGRGFFTRLSTRLPSGTLSLLIRLATLDRYMEQRRKISLGEESRNSILSTRDALQWQLLALKPAAMMEHGERALIDGNVYEVCRLTALMYSNAVLLGLPPDNGWHLKLARRLRKLLEVWMAVRPSSYFEDVAIWALCVGGVAAQGSGDRTFFEATLREIAGRRNLRHWSSIQRILVDFIWSPEACKIGAASLWCAI